MYGTAETVVGDLAAALGLLGSLFLATKVWTTGREAGVAEMERSLRRLRVPRLDLLQVHNLVDWRTQLQTLRAWKEAGRIRYLGVTHYTTGAYGELERLMRDEPLDFVQLNYSLAEREAEQRLLPLARERGIAVLVNRPFAEGALFERVRGRALPPWAADFGAAELGPVLPQVDPGPPRRHLCDPGHEQTAASRRQHAGGHGRSARRRHAGADDRSARDALSPPRLHREEGNDHHLACDA